LLQGHGLGIAGHYSFVSYVAVAAEVDIDGDRLVIPQVDIAIDCSPRVNPDFRDGRRRRENEFEACGRGGDAGGRRFPTGRRS
jgi:hypothetical protein